MTAWASWNNRHDGACKNPEEGECVEPRASRRGERMLRNYSGTRDMFAALPNFPISDSDSKDEGVIPGRPVLQLHCTYSLRLEELKIVANLSRSASYDRAWT